MPSISGYQTNDTLNIQDAISKITGVAAIAAALFGMTQPKNVWGFVTAFRSTITIRPAFSGSALWT